MLCLRASVKHAQLQRQRLSCGLAWTPVTDEARRAVEQEGVAEWWLCEIQATAREPESAVGCGTLTLGG